MPSGPRRRHRLPGLEGVVGLLEVLDERAPATPRRRSGGGGRRAGDRARPCPSRNERLEREARSRYRAAPGALGRRFRGPSPAPPAARLAGRCAPGPGTPARARRTAPSGRSAESESKRVVVRGHGGQGLLQPVPRLDLRRVWKRNAWFNGVARRSAARRTSVAPGCAGRASASGLMSGVPDRRRGRRPGGRRWWAA